MENVKKDPIELAIEKGLLPEGSRALHDDLFEGYAYFDNPTTGQREIYAPYEGAEGYDLRKKFPIPQQ